MLLVIFMKYYLVGIKGSGMSALASMLYDMGHEVIGSDVANNYGFEQELIKRSIKILEFSKDNINESYIYIISNAYNDSNVEVKLIKENNYQYFYYHNFISKLPGFHIAICGTHGKTTTTTFIKDLLKEEQIAYIIGDGTGGGTSNYKYLIYEACEYQDHFLSYKPEILVITNIEYDHPDYFKSLEDVEKSFNLMKQKSKIVIELPIDQYQIIEVNSEYTKISYHDNIYMIKLFGKHLIDDFILAVKVLEVLGFDYAYILKHIDNIHMPKRRMQETKIDNTILIEDYGHHPTEIKALYNSVTSKYPNIYSICLFQPHTYSRTLTFSKDFVEALKLFNEVYIDEVFTSKREPYNIETQNKVNYLFNEFNSYKNFDLNNIDFKKEQVVIILGAGDLNIRFIKNFK
jgi:UDP-N-acetylmuramate--alanine ligase